MRPQTGNCLWPHYDFVTSELFGFLDLGADFLHDLKG